MCAHRQDDHENKHKEMLKYACRGRFSTLIFTFYCHCYISNIFPQSNLIFIQTIFVTSQDLFSLSLNIYSTYIIQLYICNVSRPQTPPNIYDYFPFISILAIILMIAMYFPKYKANNI